MEKCNKSVDLWGISKISFGNGGQCAEEYFSYNFITKDEFLKTSKILNIPEFSVIKFTIQSLIPKALKFDGIG